MVGLIVGNKEGWTVGFSVGFVVVGKTDGIDVGFAVVGEKVDGICVGESDEYIVVMTLFIGEFVVVPLTGDGFAVVALLKVRCFIIEH